MKSDTPLTEVAHHLPAEAAGLLGTAPWAVQESVLRAVRDYVCYLERSEVTLDPMQYDTIIGSVVLVLMPAHNAIFSLSQQLIEEGA